MRVDVERIDALVVGDRFAGIEGGAPRPAGHPVLELDFLALQPDSATVGDPAYGTILIAVLPSMVKIMRSPRARNLAISG